jgi:gluconolactonase
LYVADIGASKTYKYHIEKDGTLSHRQLFAEMGSDGMTIDKEGNLYLTGKGVTVFNKNGKKIDHIDIPEGWSANVCIGGKNRDQLFVTASTAVYTVPLKVKGVGSK